MGKSGKSKALGGHQKIGDFFCLILREVEKLGGSEDSLLNLIKTQGENELPHLVARVLTNTARIDTMDWELIARSKDCCENVRVNALEHIDNESVLLDIAKADIEQVHESSSYVKKQISSRHQATTEGRLSHCLMCNFNVVIAVISKLSARSIVRILQDKPLDFVSECLIREAVTYACQGWNKELKKQVLEIIKTTDNIAILSQLNNDNSLGQGSDTIRIAQKRIAELGLHI